jgi:hypothetical protein
LGRDRERNLELLKQHPEPIKFRSSDGERGIFHFGTGARDHRLLLGLPWDEVGAQRDTIASCWLTIRGVPCVFEVTISIEMQGTLGE